MEQISAINKKLYEKCKTTGGPFLLQTFNLVFLINEGHVRWIFIQILVWNLTLQVWGTTSEDGWGRAGVWKGARVVSFPN